MSVDLLADWWVHQVSITPLTGQGATGPIYGTPIVVTGLVDHGDRLVLGTDGQQLIATATVYLPATTPNIPVGSQLTLPVLFGGRTVRVLTFKRHDAGSQPTPNHCEMAVQ